MSNPKTWQQTYTKRPFRWDAMEENDISIDDIAIPLSNIPRFQGASLRQITVAEHSLVVAKILEQWKQKPIVVLHGLLHDAHEAFIGDIPSPLKHYWDITHGFSVREFEAQTQFHIMYALGIPNLEHKSEVDYIKQADRTSLKIERDLFMQSSLQWADDTVAYPPHYTEYYLHLSRQESYEMFMLKYNQLVKDIAF